MEIRRLKKENYDELISLLNLVFSKQNNCTMDFEKELPNMCIRDDLHMRKHVGLFIDGKLVSVVGVYPLPTNVLNSKIFAGFFRNFLKPEIYFSGINDNENIEITEEKVDAEIAKMAEMYKMEVEKLKEYMGEDEKKQMKADMAVQEAVTLLVESSVEE